MNSKVLANHSHTFLDCVHHGKKNKIYESNCHWFNLMKQNKYIKQNMKCNMMGHMHISISVKFQ